MPAVNGMQRVMFKGVPVLKSSDNNLYIYNPVSSDHVKIGSVSEGLLPNWREIYTPILAAYRNELAPRLRAASAAQKK